METPALAPLLRADRMANRGNPKGLLIVVAYRIAHHATTHWPRWAALPVVVLHRALTEVVLGVEFPAAVTAGPGLQIWHGTGLVVHSGTRLGSNVVLRHQTTIGTAGRAATDRPPTIGDHVEIGAGALIIGDVTIGERAVIGAGAVVVGNVPSGATVVGNPARVVAEREPSETGTGT